MELYGSSGTQILHFSCSYWTTYNDWRCCLCNYYFLNIFIAFSHSLDFSEKRGHKACHWEHISVYTKACVVIRPINICRKALDFVLLCVYHGRWYMCCLVKFRVSTTLMLGQQFPCAVLHFNNWKWIIWHPTGWQKGVGPGFKHQMKT